MPFDAKQYPANWTSLKNQVLRRAQYRCEGSPAYPTCRAKHEELHPVTNSLVILAIAHYDRDLGNNNLLNLRAWCQRCHLRHDWGQHIDSRKYGKDYRKRQLAFPFYDDIKPDVLMLKEYLNLYFMPQLECDGQTQVFSHLLESYNILHSVKVGSLWVDEEYIQPHWWIEVHDIIVDYKARMWLGDQKTVPHGCFYRVEYPLAIYDGDKTKISVNKGEFNVLTLPLLEQQLITTSWHEKHHRRITGRNESGA